MPTPKCPFTPDDARPVGSQWLCVNFHTHTPGSSDYMKAQRPTTDGPAGDGAGGLAPVDIARAILRECVTTGVRVLAVTDHNSPSFQLRPRGKTALVADPERETYYAMMRRVQREEGGDLAGILVLPGVEVGAENIHVLGIFPPSPEPGADVLKIAGLLDQGGCPLELYGDARASCTQYSISDAIDAIDARGGIAIPAHIDGASGFLTETTQKRLLSLILSRPHLFALEYLRDEARRKLDALLAHTPGWDVLARRGGSELAWVQSSDSHFTRTLPFKGKPSGAALGTTSRRTHLLLDPAALTFNAVRAALRDPQNRVRVDHTDHPTLRQGALATPAEARTTVLALRLEPAQGAVETLRFGDGLSTLLGPSNTGKSARMSAFRVVNGREADLALDGQELGPVPLKRADLLLAHTEPGQETQLWWLHRGAATHVRATACAVAGGRLVPDPARTVETALDPDNAALRRRALQNDLRTRREAGALIAEPAIPTVYSVVEMQDLLACPVRTARFIEWHHAPAALLAERETLHGQLRALVSAASSRTARQLARRLATIFEHLDPIRQGAVAELNALYRDASPGLAASRSRGLWRKDPDGALVRAAEQLLALRPGDETTLFDCLRPVEDKVTLTLRGLDPTQLSPQLRTALTGILLVTAARGLGPVIVDAPEAYFNPAELVEALAPAILQAKDQGRQFIVAVSDPAFPFAADAELVIPCERDRSCAGVGTLSPAQGGLDNPRTAAWLLKNWEGSAKVFDRRKQLYEGVLGEMGAAERRGEMGVRE